MEREHEQRKNQIDQFFTNLKTKVDLENNLKQTELEKRQLKDKVREQVMQVRSEQEIAAEQM